MSGVLRELKVLIRGAGEMASGVAHRLVRSGLKVVCSEAPQPLAVRRAVSFCEAVYDGSQSVEGLTARLIDGPELIEQTWRAGELPLLVDPELKHLANIAPAVIVDAILAKRNLGTHRELAPLTIGLGPGFKAPDQVHLAIETNRGHNLGRLIYDGEPEPNTGVPGDIAGHSIKRVLRAPADGVFEPRLKLGDQVAEGELVATVAGQQVKAAVGGVLRGLIRPGSRVSGGLKVGDVDPRGRREYLNTISEKARALGGSVLEGIMAHFNR